MVPTEAFEEYRECLMQRIGYERRMSDEEILMLIDEVMQEKSRERYVLLSERTRLRTMLFNSVRRLDLIQELLDDDSVTEIMVNGTDAIFVERGGIVKKWTRSFETREKVEKIAAQIASGCNRIVNESEAIVDARLNGGERVNIVMHPIAIDGPVITIRRFPEVPISMPTLIEWGSITEEAALLLRKLVKARYNIFISGGTGSGKTTFLNALSNFIPADERIVTIEDNAELQLKSAENLVRLEARRANEEGSGEVTIRDLIRASLRMRPDRIIVGEVRGDETIDMLQAMNTGHDGSLSTGHGNSPTDMLSRLETMVLMGMDIPIAAIRRQIASGIDIMVHLGRLRDKSRRVLEILEVDGYDQSSGEILTHKLFEFEEQGDDENGHVKGGLVKCGLLQNTGKIERAGIFSTTFGIE